MAIIQTQTQQHSSSSSSSPIKARYSRQYPLGNHLWVNTERLNASLNPLSRRRVLDQMARYHAEEMANRCKVFSSSRRRRTSSSSQQEQEQPQQQQQQEQQQKGGTASSFCISTIEENCLVGPSIQTVHKLTMAGSPDDEARKRILNPTYTKFGMGAVKGTDNNIYICQLFC